MANFTAALNVIGTGFHVTLCFSECKKSSKVRTSTETGKIKVVSIEYWEHCDLTVAIVESEFCDKRADYWAENGYGYDLGYKPHFTITKGNQVEAVKTLIGAEFDVGDEYVRIF